MDQSYFDFYEKNFSQIIFANNHLQEFFNDIAKKIKEEIAIDRYYNTIWGSYERAIRFYPFKNDINATLIFKENGKFSIAIYYYDKFDFKTEIHEYIGNSNYEYYDENSICRYTRLPGKEFAKLEDANKEILIQLEKQKEYYSPSF